MTICGETVIHVSWVTVVVLDDGTHTHTFWFVQSQYEGYVLCLQGEATVYFTIF